MSHDLQKTPRYVIITDGFDLVHGPFYNGPNNQTTTGQPFMITSDTEEDVINLFFSEYRTYWVDHNGSSTDEYGEPYTETTGKKMMISYIKRDITWDVGYDSLSSAQQVCDLVSVASGGYFKIKPIKHPTQNIWATPNQEFILNSLHNSPYKDHLLSLSNYSINKGNRKTGQQMKNEGWV